MVKITLPELQGQVVMLNEMGRSISYILEKTGLSLSTIQRIIKRGSVKQEKEYGPNTGRPSKLSVIQKRRLVGLVKRNKRITLSEAKERLEYEISDSTVSRVLKSKGVRQKKLQTKPSLTEEHKKKRVDYALSHASPDFDWGHWINSDEKKWNLDGPDGYRYYWHFKGSKSEIFSKDHNTRTSLMYWGGIWKSGKTDLIKVEPKSNSSDYIEILKEGLLPIYRRGFIFQQDGAKIHTSKETMKWLKKKKITTPKWPPKSPDLSPIENVWGIMVKKVYFGKPRYKNLETLERAIFNAWESIGNETLASLIESMPRRMRKVIESNGSPINY